MTLRRTTLTVLVGLLHGAALLSQPVTQVADVNPGPPEPVVVGGPEQFATAGGRVVFFSSSPSEPGVRLWSTDGSDAGTRALQTFDKPAFAPHIVAQAFGLAFFLADQGPGPRLFRTDGTRAGTLALSPVLSTVPDRFAVTGSHLYFGACLGSACSLWKSDGRQAQAVARVRVFELVARGERIFFLGARQRAGLFTSDGTKDGTVLVREVGGNLQDLGLAGTRLYFMAGDLGSELWTSDGTRRGTAKLKTFFECDGRFCGRNTHLLATVGETLYLEGQGDNFGIQLWLTDGTPAGTRRLTNATLAVSKSAEVSPPLQVAGLGGGRALFIHSGIAGPRLWITRGSPATTEPLTGCPGGCPAVESGLVGLGPRVLFVGDEPRHGKELWVSDGSGAGTRLLTDLCPGRCSFEPTRVTVLAGRIFFQATQGGAFALWTTDGTAAGTRRLGPLAPPPAFAPALDVAVGKEAIVFGGEDPLHGRQPWVFNLGSGTSQQLTVTESSGASSDPRGLVVVGERLVFAASQPEQQSVFSSNGEDLLSLPGSAAPVSRNDASNLTPAAGRAFWTVDRGEGAGVELWASDGFAPGTVLLATFHDKTVSDLREIGGRLAFRVSSTVGERPVHAFWTSDGTVAGTEKSFDLVDDAVGVHDVTDVGGGLFFFTLLRETTVEIVASDGTAAGTRTLLEVVCRCPEPIRYARAGGQVYFTAARKGTVGLEAFRSDGTPEGTLSVFAPGDPGRVNFIERPFELGGRVYFFSDRFDVEPNHSVLFRLDGDKVTFIARVGGVPFEPIEPETVILGETATFRGFDSAHGLELWKTDGTAEGTVLVRDIAPGPASSDPRDLVLLGGKLFFSASDGRLGRELWASDGTAAGTRLVEDLAPGAASSSPGQLTPLLGHLYFAADDRLTGRELWRLAVPAAGCTPSAARLCLLGFAVEATWRDPAGAARPATTIPLSSHAGFFAFEDPSNPEVIVRLTETDGQLAVVYGSLTDREVNLTVTDPVTGTARRYFKPAGIQSVVADPEAFGPEGAKRTKAFCIPGPTRLCLLAGRFAVQVVAPSVLGPTAGAGFAGGAGGGYFWLDDSTLPDMAVKIVDGRAVNGHFWLFVAGLTDIAYTVVVVDTETGNLKTYTVPSGRFAAFADTEL